MPHTVSAVFDSWCVETYLRVELELVVQDIVAPLVDFIRRVALVLGARIYRAPLAIPDAKSSLVHPGALLCVALRHAGALLFCVRVRLGGVGEAVDGVVVDGVRGVGPAGARIVGEAGEVRRVGVAVEEEDVVRVDGADRCVDVVVEADESAVVRVGGLVHGVVTGDPLSMPVLINDFSP